MRAGGAKLGRLSAYKAVAPSFLACSIPLNPEADWPDRSVVQSKDFLDVRCSSDASLTNLDVRSARSRWYTVHLQLQRCKQPTAS